MWPEGLHSYGNSPTRTKGDPHEGWHKQDPEDGGIGAPLYHHARLLGLKLPKYRPSLETPQHGKLQPNSTRVKPELEREARGAVGRHCLFT